MRVFLLEFGVRYEGEVSAGIFSSLYNAREAAIKNGYLDGNAKPTFQNENSTCYPAIQGKVCSYVRISPFDLDNFTGSANI